MLHPSQFSVLLLFPLASVRIFQEERKPMWYMLHLLICWRREKSRNVQGIQVRVLLMLMRCLLQSNSNYPFRGCQEFGVLHYIHYSLRVWEPMKVQFSQGGDEQQYICLACFENGFFKCKSCTDRQAEKFSMTVKVTALLLYLWASHHQRTYSRADIPTTPGCDKCTSDRGRKRLWQM